MLHRAYLEIMAFCLEKLETKPLLTFFGNFSRIIVADFRFLQKNKQTSKTRYKRREALVDLVFPYKSASLSADLPDHPSLSARQNEALFRGMAGVHNKVHGLV